MEIKSIKRPWEKKVKQGNRYNKDQFYNTKEWKQTKVGFTLSEPWQVLPPILGIPFSNKYCSECWKEGKIVEHQMTDHVIPIKQGGSRTEYTNLNNLCNHHHAQKSAREKNEKYKV